MMEEVMVMAAEMRCLLCPTPAEGGSSCDVCACV